jgi:hypothetical protein
MKLKFLYGVFISFMLLLTACGSDEQPLSKNELYPYFYPYDSIPKVYVYRDEVNGISEKFHRVYGIEDSYGKHIVVELFSEDGRIIEAYNYMLDSLRLIDHMVVNRKGIKTQAMLMKNALFPFNMEEKTWFASKAPGFLDSTLILAEVLRGVEKKPFKDKVLNEKVEMIMMSDTLRNTILNPFTRKEVESIDVFKSYFAKGYGLVRVHDINKKTDFKLEKILSQEEFVTIMNR